MHQVNLLLNNLLPVFSMLHGLTIEVEVLGIDRLLVEQLVEFGAQVFEPVIPLSPGAMVAQSFNINDAANIGRDQKLD